MDQESFRKLLQTPSSNRTPTSTYTTWDHGKKAKTKKADPSQPAFKPRSVKKAEDSYRDRASERRHGIAHDYAQVEALAEDFEKRNADKDRATVEEQRRYLGGDSEHTVLVKGLDFALLEQNKARASAATEDDDALEQVFQEASSSVSKKRTREDIVRELKNKRQKSEAAEDVPAVKPDAPLEQAKKAGKFKPIGFKPIGSTEGTKKKKAKAKEEGAGAGVPVKAVPEPVPEPLNEDFDIFADAEEYAGVDLGDDDESDSEPTEKDDKQSTPPVDVPAKGKWFETEDPEPGQLETPATPEGNLKSPSTPPPEREDGEEQEEEEAPVRLVPLASSSVPSIRDLLAMDAEVGKREQRKAKKEKRKGGLSAEGKIDRDYQKLKAYTDKKDSGK
ncbi:hypothetical protein EW026_g4710 [Hermanssonia centrifuga]|uniref:RED-like N-terminal domain-containing protein n=1 Tax=Hermanssonia centrifuga TaxID=98765 RepID=A0A4S4KGA8_9APHY|nr:hypothetical protein EW026_g4710 [Hermanssonia centrifuga]